MIARRVFALLLSAAVALSACGPAETPPPTATEVPTDTPIPSPADTPTPEPTPTVTPVPVDDSTLRTLQEVEVPRADPIDLAYMLGGVEEEIPVTLEPPASFPSVGAKETFWVTNDRNESFQITATLQYVTDHGYFWVDDEAQYDQGSLEKLGNTFENRIYPNTREFFGSEWTPGIDGDPHIYILYARRLGINIGGYFSSADSFHPLVHPHSNAHEMFVFNADNVGLDEPYTYGVLAHEFQHMIHWNVDRDETTWLNEGLAELSVVLNRYDVGSVANLYTEEPDLQLNDWPYQEETGPHYGAAFLFVTYMLNRLGEEFTQSVVGHPEDGLESIDAVLAEEGHTDPLTGEPLTADDLVLDWALTNFLADKELADGRYYYHSYITSPRARQSDLFRTCEIGTEPTEYEVHQYGVDYVRVLCPGSYTMRFDGAEQVQVVPADAHSGSFSFWSNKGDEADMTLTRRFDFTGHEGPLTLSFWTWYQIEEDWDYVYLLASTDGENWEMIQTPSGTDENPTGNNYGWGWTGATRGSEWIEEQVDLSDYAGQEVIIRFEYVTDAAVNGEGMLIDDLSVPEIGYATDFEEDDGGWEAAGFVRIENVLPQTFRLALIRHGEATEVSYLDPGVNNLVDIPLELAEEGESATLVVIGTTRFTRMPASYSVGFLP